MFYPSQAVILLFLFYAGCTGDPTSETDTNAGDDDTVDEESSDTGNGSGEPFPPEMVEGASELLLLDDFDDGDITNETGGKWIAWDDRLKGGESSVRPQSYEDGSFETDAPGFGDTGFAVHVIAETSDVLGWDFVGIEALLDPDAFCPTATPTDLDLNSYDGVQFMAKGGISSGTLSFKIYHVKDGPEGVCGNGYFDSLTGWADYQYSFHEQLKDEWSLIRIPFNALTQPSWSVVPVPLDGVLSHAKSFTWVYEQPGGSADFWIDHVTLFKNSEAATD